MTEKTSFGGFLGNNAIQLRLKKKFEFLNREAKDLYLHPEVTIIDTPVTALEFHRRWVSPNVPLLIKGAVNHWPAVKKWGQDYFREVLGEKEVSVAVTPTGYADAIATSSDGLQYFVEPEERRMTMSQFLDVMRRPDDQAGVFYVQKQDSNFTNEFPELLADIESDIGWAREAFDASPAAINLWMGDQRAVTSMHKDPFENIYCVISGHKDFTLLPPTDRPWIPYERFPAASYKETHPGHFEIIPKNTETHVAISTLLDDLSDGDDGSVEDDEDDDDHLLDSLSNLVPWICIDPLRPDVERYPLYRNANPIVVRVEAGDLLYLPSLWFHHVQQSHACIAVNYWYDMQFDIKYAYFNFLESLSKFVSS